ncbi:MAG: 3'-5' exonuclease domain-containing protein 2 [Bacteroides sp.]|nr:3'-5' exonuclease domain-containing protein 2 [Roseburia sp.]MCM1347154.1 3'-5' exonuclease domain-containing protein 2 [Bacteroides sp.]MCM1421005.1 3'-5' exonuclease domain-containing protein 2 [Bacteroides sp.]
MTIIREKFDKKKLNELPRAIFQGRIVTIFTEAEAEKAVEFLIGQPILGIDTETRPSFRRGHTYQVALLQVATPDICFLFRLNRIGMTDAVKQLLEDCSTLKVGLSLNDDMRALNARGQFTPGLFADIQQEVKEIGIADMSLQKIYANLFKQKIAKTQQLSNWEADILSDAQKLYAATDAWACIMIHQELKRLKKTGDYTLVREESHAEDLPTTISMRDNANP